MREPSATEAFRDEVLTRLASIERRLGSAALDLCYVAAGRFDGFYEMSLKAWDVAAGLLLVADAPVAIR